MAGFCKIFTQVLKWFPDLLDAFDGCKKPAQELKEAIERKEAEAASLTDGSSPSGSGPDN